MHNRTFSSIQKITISGMVMACYIAILYMTQSFSFGPYQIRIATALYGLSYHMPFLIIPMGLANFISNLIFGGLGPVDMIGGCIVGIITTALIAGIRRFRLPTWLCCLPIVLIPGFGVSIWISAIFHTPYLLQAFTLCIGQLIPGICGTILIKAIGRYVFHMKEVTA
ncbi:MAG: QueT transporter family protein [Lachnospiraceae bacterium]